MGEDREIPSRDCYLEHVLGEGGVLARAWDGYQPRAGQRALAEAVDRAIAGGTNLLAEAGCGTGKGYGYSIPATYHAATRGDRILIVTANIALQEQLVGKDLPALQRLLPWPFTFSLLKGRSHFLCAAAYREDEGRRGVMLPGFEGERHGDAASGATTAEERRQLPIVDAWADESLERGWFRGAHGDVSELPFEPLPKIWKRYSVAADECRGSTCSSREECFAYAAKERAKAADVVVTNYHMLCAHLSVMMDVGLELVLPHYDVVICDESHKLPSVVRDFFGFQITQESIRRSARRLQNEPVLASSIERAAGWLFTAMAELRRDRDRYKARIPRGALSRDERAAWENMRGLLDDGIAKLRSQQAAMAGAGAGERGLHKMNLAVKRMFLARFHLGRAFEGDPSNEQAYFLEEIERGQGRVAISGRLIDAGETLRESLFANTKTVVCTSATLADGEGSASMSFFAAEAGCDKADCLVAESPFDWKTQCLFIVPETMPSVDDKEGWKIAVAEHVRQIVLLARGRTLGLFTSRRMLDFVHDELISTCRMQGYKLLKQGDLPRTKLVEEFKRDVSSVLLGTESLWAGVDVPGQALSVVVMDRLPFPSPDDPVIDALSERDPKWFWHQSLPRAITQFRQGAGRAVRTISDRAVVVCLDRRILDKRYGSQFLLALPHDVPKSKRLEDIAEWLGEPGPEAAIAEPEPEAELPYQGVFEADEYYVDDGIPF